MRKSALAVIVTMILGGVGTASAAALEELTIELWPEYDRAAMLVMIQGKLAQSETLPASVTVSIPTIAGNPHAVAFLGPKNNLLTMPYKRTVEGASAKIAFSSKGQVFRVEYYAPLEIKGVDRRFVFAWPKAPKIDKLQFAVQTPAASSALTTEPATRVAGRGDNGLVYRVAEIGASPAGADLKLTLAYQNSSGRLSHVSLPQAASPAPSKQPPAQAAATLPPAATAAPSSGLPSWLIWGLLILAGAGVGAWLGRRRA